MGETFKFKQQLSTQAGIHAPRPMEKQGVRCTAGLCGEVYKNEDPQETTEVQRAWLPTHDPSITYYRVGKTTQKFEKDNELSLPLGEGTHAKFELSDQNGFYRRITSDITRVKNTIITQK
jgi:hypothetical protein